MLLLSKENFNAQSCSCAQATAKRSFSLNKQEQVIFSLSLSPDSVDGKCLGEKVHSHHFSYNIFHFSLAKTSLINSIIQRQASG
jgi:hypothetical protein